MTVEKQSRNPNAAQAFSDSETKLKTHKKRKTITTKKKNPATMSFPTKFAGK